MRKILKYVTIAFPFFVVIVIQTIVSFAGVISYYLFDFVSVTFPNNQFNVGTGNVAQMILKEVALKNTSWEYISILIVFVGAISLFLFYFWTQSLEQTDILLNLERIITIKNLIILLIISILWRLLQLGIINGVIPYIKNKPTNFDGMTDYFLEGKLIFTLVFSLVLAPISEELIFRGVILKRAKQVIPITGAILIQALLFTVFRFNLDQGIVNFFTGTLLGYIACRYNSVIASILLNIFLVVVGYVIIII